LKNIKGSKLEAQVARISATPSRNYLSQIIKVVLQYQCNVKCYFVLYPQLFITLIFSDSLIYFSYTINEG